MVGRKSTRNRKKRGRLAKVIQFLFVVAVLCAMTVGATIFFQVEQVEVAGNARYTQEDIIAATGIQAGDNLFRMNKFAIQAKVLEEMPYLEDILIRRKLPSTITITVREWDAVAQLMPNPDWVAPEPEKKDEKVPEASEQAWLISVGGKLLEPAPPDSTRMEISGLTALDARAGTQAQVPSEEGSRLGAALKLLAELEVQKLTASVSRLAVTPTHLRIEYLGRYDVKLPLFEDFAYQLEALQAAVADQEGKRGDQIEGTFDLTQKNYTVVYSPNRLP